MEIENQTTSEIDNSPLHTVTPLSKYLAMVLFIAMPFVGGWIGYKYAPEKRVEVQKIIEHKINDEARLYELLHDPYLVLEVIGQTQTGLIIDARYTDKADDGLLYYFPFDQSKIRSLDVNYDGISDVINIDGPEGFKGTKIIVFGENEDALQGSVTPGDRVVEYVVVDGTGDGDALAEISSSTLYTLAENESYCSNVGANEMFCMFDYKKTITYELGIFSNETGEKVDTLNIEVDDSSQQAVITSISD